MKWKSLLHYLSQMSPSELDQEVTVYMPFYQREFKGTVLTTLAAAKHNDFSAVGSPAVLVVDMSNNAR